MSIEAQCKCGKSLGATFTVDNDCDGKVEVESCQDCIDTAIAEAVKEAYDEGVHDGEQT